MINKLVLVYILSSLLILLPPKFIFPMGYRENKINGNSLYKKEKFEEAAVEFSIGLEKKADFDLYFSRGVSYYKLGQYDKSFSDFEDAGTYSNSEKDQIKAVYNAGNSNFMLAETVKTDNPQLALEHFTKAVNHFERVLQLDTENPEAAYNLELSRLRLDELEKQQNEDQEDGDQQSDEQQEQDQQISEQQVSENQNSNQQQKEIQQSENSESSFSSEEISPEDILNEEARRQEAMQTVIDIGSGESVDKDW